MTVLRTPYAEEAAGPTIVAAGRGRAFLLACTAVLAGLAILFVVFTWRWPIVSDAALIRYTVFLFEQGWTPYRDVLDVNMPGAYWVTAAAMHVPGPADMSWRLFDLGLVAAAAAAYYAIARVHSRFAALFAGVMLLLVHGQDGIQQAGQRDLVMAVLLLAGVACMFAATRRDRGVYLLGFGLAVGFAATIKPTAAPVGLVLLAMCLAHRARGSSPRRDRLRGLFAWGAAGLAGLLIPLGSMLLWLQRYHAVTDWLQVQRVLLPYYATLGRRPPGFTLLHSVSPLLPLVLLWLVCVATRRPRWNGFERRIVVTVTALSLLSLLVQGKALPYQRYPMLAFLLLLMGLDLSTALHAGLLSYRRRHTLSRAAAVAGLACGCLVLAPLALLRVHRFVPTQEFRSMLAADLHRLHADTSNSVQCIDTIQECLPTLSDLRVLPATGTLYDIFLFGDAQQPALQLGRRRFLTQVAAHAPAVIVVVSGTFLESSRGYGKLETWPAFSEWLAQHYTLDAERVPSQPVRWWSRPQQPAGYRLYVANPSPAPLAGPLR